MCGPGIHDGGIVRREKQSNLETMAAETKLARVVGLIGFKKKGLNRYNEWERIPDIVKKKLSIISEMCSAKRSFLFSG